MLNLSVLPEPEKWLEIVEKIGFGSSPRNPGFPHGRVNHFQDKLEYKPN
jgi:hypothetical protein